jgi:hypothetical protein
MSSIHAGLISIACWLKSSAPKNLSAEVLLLGVCPAVCAISSGTPRIANST